MIADLQPYPEYKESGVSWIGRIPQGWDVQRTKWLFRYRKEINSARQHSNILSLTLRGVVNNDPNDPEGLVPKDYGTYQLFRKDDLVFKLIDLENLRTSRVGLVHEDGIMSPAYVRLISNNPAGVRFFFLQFYDLYSRGVYNQLGAGVRSTLGPSDLLNHPVCLPPPAEQAAIVRFLDDANSRLERAIRAKRKVIALLNEQKQAIIHRAVTRGLDPAVPLKPSGIPWLGDIPQHWELTKLKHLSPQITVGIVIQPARLYVPKGVPCLRSLNISSGRITTSEMVFISEDSHRNNRKSQLNQGDVVLVRTGRTGVAVIVPPEFHGANCIDLLIIRKTERLMSEYLLVYFQSYGAKSDIAFNSVGAIQAHYNTATLANLRIPLPSIPEQQAILRRVETDLAPLDTAIAGLEREIELLREYRTRLVADVVTGKLDVRAAAALLPAAPLAPVPEPEVEELPEMEEAEA